MVNFNLIWNRLNKIKSDPIIGVTCSFLLGQQGNLNSIFNNWNDIISIGNIGLQGYEIIHWEDTNSLAGLPNYACFGYRNIPEPDLHQRFQMMLSSSTVSFPGIVSLLIFGVSDALVNVGDAYVAVYHVHNTQLTRIP